MPTCLRRTIGLPPVIPSTYLKMSPDVDHRPRRFSGDCNSVNGRRGTLRRTLSAADMSSKIFMNQGGSIKKIASVEHLPNLIHEEDPDQNGSRSGAIEEIWSSIENREDQRKTEYLEKRQSDVWGSIIDSKKKEDDVVPYVHPMMKRSTSSLSEKSLEICTESLGSETGADVFSLCVDSEKKEGKNDDVEIIAEEDQKTLPRHEEKKVLGPTQDYRQETVHVVSVARNTSFMKKAGSAGIRALPPPLPSLAADGGGSNVQMRSHRENGRLVVEAVSVPSRNCFRAERHEGRLLLTFSDEDTEEEEEELEDEELQDEEDEELTEKENEIAMKRESGMINYAHYKFLCLTRTPGITKLTNGVDQSTVSPTSEPPSPWAHNRQNKVVSSTLAKPYSKFRHLNPYVYSWRSNQLPDGSATVATSSDKETCGGGVMVVKGNCNQRPTTRSQLLGDARCIATS